MSKRLNAATVLVAMVAVMLAAVPVAAEGVATTTATVRRVVVSIPDRKLAVIEDGAAVEVYDVAVGKPSTPSPVGTFTIVNRIAHPTYYRPGVVIGPGDRLSTVDGLLTGWHPPEASHLRMLAAVADQALLQESYAVAAAQGYLWHEFGDVHLLLP